MIIKTNDKTAKQYGTFPDEDTWGYLFGLVENKTECNIIGSGSFDFDGVKNDDFVCVKVENSYLFFSKYQFDLLLTHYPNASKYISNFGEKNLCSFFVNDLFVGGFTYLQHMNFEDLPELIKNRILEVENQ